ncbi:MAG: repeat-associated core domain protein [Planctomycetaceae bacterium]|nr:repeat-associated core domain protein [Planctomycetaceae bacterium]
MPIIEYVWDIANDSYLLEILDHHTVLAVYTQLPNENGFLLSKRSDSTSYIHADATESIRLLTDLTQSPSGIAVFDAWGLAIANPFSSMIAFAWGGCLGYYFDAMTNSYYIRRRQYSYESARWLSLDPLNFADSENRYLAFHNAPLTVFDPSGLAPSGGKKCGGGTITITKASPGTYDGAWCTPIRERSIYNVLCDCNCCRQQRWKRGSFDLEFLDKRERPQRPPKPISGPFTADEDLTSDINPTTGDLVWCERAQYVCGHRCTDCPGLKLTDKDEQKMVCKQAQAKYMLWRIKQEFKVYIIDTCNPGTSLMLDYEYYSTYVEVLFDCEAGTYHGLDVAPSE